MIKLNKKKVLRTISIIIFIFIIIWTVIAQPSFTSNKPTTATLNKNDLKAHVNFMSVEAYPRSVNNFKNMEKVATYVEEKFKEKGCQTLRQEVKASGKTYCNIIGKINEGKGHKMIIGAHYDSHQTTPGADDNASGVAGLIEIAGLLTKANLDYEIELVAYTLEEPPHFASNRMGSVVHAKSLNEKKEKIDGVIVFEMIGYFSDDWFSQGYPMPFLYLMYPLKGNFITVVGCLDQKSFTKQVKTGMQGSTDLPIYSINAPAKLPGIDLSDHRSYWAFDYNAVMITDTAFYRNKSYHKDIDIQENLDFERMRKVILSVYNYLLTRNIK